MKNCYLTTFYVFYAREAQFASNSEKLTGQFAYERVVCQDIAAPY